MFVGNGLNPDRVEFFPPSASTNILAFRLNLSVWSRQSSHVGSQMAIGGREPQLRNLGSGYQMEEMKHELLEYESPAIRLLGGADVYFDRLLRSRLAFQGNTDWRATKIKEFIDAYHWRVRQNIDDVCKHLGLPVSGRQARRLFKLSTGIGIRLYIRNRRLLFAMEQLKLPEKAIKVIAIDLGFQSSRQFRRYFKEFFHLSPQEFRKIYSANRPTSNQAIQSDSSAKSVELNDAAQHLRPTRSG